jgi:hypothetical protein
MKRFGFANQKKKKGLGPPLSPPSKFTIHHWGMNRGYSWEVFDLVFIKDHSLFTMGIVKKLAQ